MPLSQKNVILTSRVNEMILYLEESEAWSLMMLVSAVATDSAELSPKGKEAIKRWRSDRKEGTEQLKELSDALSEALNQQADAKFKRRVKGARHETVRK